MRPTHLARPIGLALAIISCDGVTEPPPTEDAQYDVLFAGTLETGATQLFTARVDGGTPVALAGGIMGAFPSVSADGRIVVFNTMDESGEYRLMILRPGMAAPVELGGTSGLSGLQPSLDSDGSRIAFSSPRDDSYRDVFAADVAGTAVTNVRRLTSTAGPEVTAVWSPDGQRIAFTSYRTGYPSIWVMNADGLDARQVTFGENAFSDYFPSWSPDGSRLTFQRIGATFSRIGIVSSSGGVATFFDLPGRSYSPRWSPDGAYIAIASSDDDIAILSADGMLVRRIEREGVDRSPIWVRRDSPWVQAPE